MNKINWTIEAPMLLYYGKEGLNQSEIARKYGLSRERIRQVINKFCPDWKREYGVKVRQAATNAAVKEIQRKRYGDDGNKHDLYKVRREKYNAKRANAQRFRKEFSIYFGDIDWPTHCPVLGIELNYFSEGRQENSVSFDRKNPTKGYIKDNVVILSWRANRIKNDGTAEEHELIAKYIKSQ